MPKGLHKIKLAFEELPALLSVSPATKVEQIARVKNKNKTKVYFGLISNVGNISGKVKIEDKYQRITKIDDIVVLVLNDKNEEVKYTTIEEDGSYYISGLSPGKYTVKIDDNFIESYYLKPKSEKSIIVEIPPVYEDYIDLKNVDLEFIKTIPSLKLG